MNNTINRFAYILELSDVELLEERDATKEEIAYLEEALDDPCASSEQKSEIENSDLPYMEDKLEILNDVAYSRGLIKKK